MPKITKRLVDSQKPKQSRYYVWDADLKGFGLLVLPTGVKSYVFQYRTPEGRTRRITIGKHGTVTPDAGRDTAKKYRRAIEDGKDPLAEKRERRQAETVAGMLDRYLNSETFAEKADSTKATDRGRIERHLKPVFGRKFADRLTGEEVRKGLAAIRAGKTAGDIKTGPRGLARVRGGDGTARLCGRLLKAVYAWAGYPNPVSGIELGRDGERKAVVESMDEYAKIANTITELENTKRIRSQAADAIRVIMLTGARRGEIAGLRWKHVNLEKGLLELPWQAHKTGKKTGEVRIIQLPTPAQAIIANQPSGKPDDLVFPPTSGEGVINLSKEWRKIRREGGLREDIVLHSLRHSLATHMAMEGRQAFEIMTLLGHRNITTSQRYVKAIETARAKLADQSAAGIAAAMTGKKPGKVVKLGRAKA